MEARDHASVLPVETEEEKRHRLNFLNENRQTNTKNLIN